MTKGNGEGLGRDSSVRYQRLERIATGGMGEVWRARDTVLGREVAVKVLKQEYADDPTFRARFAAEARNAAALHHSGIAAIFDYGAVVGEAPYLVMELVEGLPLSVLLADERPVDPEQARLLALQVAEALAAAHEAGVVHRDVKPANLIVSPDGQVKITDFGIARAADSVPYTQTGQIVGTPHYISPEQARGESATSASDVYALGVVLFECLNGSRPFDADSPIATALAHIRDEVPPLPDQVPPALDHVVRRALAKDPADRYADGAAFAAALRAAGGEAVVVPPAARIPQATRVLPVAAAPAAVSFAREPAEDAAPPDERTTRSKRWPLYAAGLIVLLVLLALLVARPWADDSSNAETVQVQAEAYIGDPVEDVEAALADKGLGTRTHEVTNPGDETAGTVADLDPTGQVEKGTTVTLDVWGERPADEGDDDEGDGNGQTQEPKPEKTEESEPEKTDVPEVPEETGGSGTGGSGNGTGTGQGADGGRATGPKGD